MKLVLTGGPSGGKTTLAQAIQREFASSVCVIPEAASIVYGGGWPRRKSIEGVQHQQRAIYFVQRELESLLAFENSDKLLVCDRGSIDGIAYWPMAAGGTSTVSAGSASPAASQTSTLSSGTGFLDSVGSTLAREIARYDWVLHLDTAPVSSYDLTNALRNESFDEARRLNEKIKSAWSAHPQRFVVESHEGGHFIDKLQHALLIVERIVQGKSYTEILAEL
jgi:nicotinamide riboside kinase